MSSPRMIRSRLPFDTPPQNPIVRLGADHSTLPSLRMINLGRVHASLQRAEELLEGGLAIVDERLEMKARSGSDT